MSIPALSALSAFSSIAPFAEPSSASPAASGVSGFTDFLTRHAQDTAKALGEAESVSLDGVAGKASLQEIATKVMAAERSLQTAIALRDRFVSALQEISRLQI